RAAVDAMEAGVRGRAAVAGTERAMAAEPVANRVPPHGGIARDRQARGQRGGGGARPAPDHDGPGAGHDPSGWDPHAPDTEVAVALGEEDVALERELRREARGITPQVPLEEALVPEVVGARRARVRHRLEADERVADGPHRGGPVRAAG